VAKQNKGRTYQIKRMIQGSKDQQNIGNAFSCLGEDDCATKINTLLSKENPEIRVSAEDLRNRQKG
jgi:hypothetical protein